VGLLMRVGSFFMSVITKIVNKSHIMFGDASQLLELCDSCTNSTTLFRGTDLLYFLCPALKWWLPPLFLLLQSVCRAFICTTTSSTSRLARC
jgi:hypothetical protein